MPTTCGGASTPRCAIRSARRNAPDFPWSLVISNGLDAFYDVFAVNMRDLGSPVHGAALLRRDPGRLRRQGADRAGAQGPDRHRRPRGAGVQGHPGRALGVLPPPALRSLPERAALLGDPGAGLPRGLRPLRLRPIQPAIPAPTASSASGGRRKSRCITIRSPQARRGALLSPTDSRGALLVALWSRLPVPVTRHLGPRLRKYLTQ